MYNYLKIIVLLTLTNIPSILLLNILFLLLISSVAYGLTDNVNDPKKKNINSLMYIANDYYCMGQHRLAIQKYKETLDKKPIDSVIVYKQLACCYAKIHEAELASEYIEKYIKASTNVAFIEHSYFDEISDSKAYQEMAHKYIKKVDLWTIFCLCIGFMGFFISIVLNFRSYSDRIANFLMSSFVLLHSFFIIHLFLRITNYSYYLPHTLHLSTLFSFLYGPLIYFYFKRVKIDYKFRRVDIWHLLPTVLLLVLLLPIYVLPEEEKLRMMLHNDVPYLTVIPIIKLLSLFVYGVLVIRMYVQSINKSKNISRIEHHWQRNIAIFCSLYIITYIIYTILVLQSIDDGFLFHLQVASMSLLVLYVSYTAFVQPSIFGNIKIQKEEQPSEVFTRAKLSRYQNSGLTDSLSLELKERLLYLLNTEKVFKQNDITLQTLSELLDTTRHNASQVINEHFNLNFFELINTYRIKEAKEILRVYGHKDLNIIDVAYEVGFNNKVTFNRSFKKYNQITPSEYVKSLVA